MLEKPAIQDEEIIACLEAQFGLYIAQLAFLPLGADRDTAVYRADVRDGTACFVKLRSGGFAPHSVTLPEYFYNQGVAQIIPPLRTAAGALWAELGDFKLILYPFIAGRDGYEVSLSDAHWVALGAALRRIQALRPPAALLDGIPRETYTPHFRDEVREFMARAGREHFGEPAARALAEIFQANRAAILDVVDRAARYAAVLQAQAPEPVVCHADIHAGNVLIDARGALYIVDWDTLILAPKERDLMYAGGGQFVNARTPQEEEALFYQGFGETPVNRIALSYYRYERIVQDLAAYGEQLFLSDEGGEDRAQSLVYVQSNFRPGNTIAIAYAGDRASDESL